MLMDWQCLQFSAGRLVGRIPSRSHWIIPLNHSHVGRSTFWGSLQYCQTPAVAIERYYARSEILFIQTLIWFFLSCEGTEAPSDNNNKTRSQEHYTILSPMPINLFLQAEILLSLLCTDAEMTRAIKYQDRQVLMQTVLLKSSAYMGR